MTSIDGFVVRPMLPEPKRLVLEALRSDRFRQGRNWLASQHIDGLVYHCCMGVMCEVAIEAGVDIRRAARPSGLAHAYNGHTILPPAEVAEWLFGTPRVQWKVPVVDDTGGLLTTEEVVKPRDLSALNDDDGWSFEEIADAIEEGL